MTGFEALDDLLAAAVDSGAVPHVAAIVADRDGTLYEGGAGVRVAGGNEPVGPSTPFRIMSMTKPVVTVLALQQRDLGALDFAAPVASYCPEFADLQVLDGWDGDTPRLRAPATQATVRQLVTHTSGLSYWFWNADLVRYEKATGVPNVSPGDVAALRAPLVADPGTRFEYGISTDWLGRVLEAVTGRGLDELVEQGVTGPLGMPDTGFRLAAANIARAVTVHRPAGDGGWLSAGELLSSRPDWWSGGHGLYSTPRDYVRFERALLRGGELDGRRILRERTVDEAFTDQLDGMGVPDVFVTARPRISDDLRLGPGWTWGYGLLLNTADVPGRRRAATGGWSGLYNTHFFVDRSSGICASIYTNALPFAAPAAWTLYGEFEDAVYAALGSRTGTQSRDTMEAGP